MLAPLQGKELGEGPGERGAQPSCYLIILPLREIDLEGGQGELLAHSPLVVDSFGLQGRALGGVPERAERERTVRQTLCRIPFSQSPYLPNYCYLSRLGYTFPRAFYGLLTFLNEYSTKMHSAK